MTLTGIRIVSPFSFISKGLGFGKFERDFLMSEDDALKIIQDPGSAYAVQC